MGKVAVTAYSPQWPGEFARIRAELAAAFALAAPAIEHIGSTAVAGLAAKPVIDVLVGVRALAEAEACVGRLAALGYRYVPDHEDELPGRRYFVKDPAGPLRVHVHAVEQGGGLWRDHLAFRDALRSDAALRGEYQALKLALAARHAEDRAAYTDAKAPFIRDVLARLRGGG